MRIEEAICVEIYQKDEMIDAYMEMLKVRALQPNYYALS